MILMEESSALLRIYNVLRSLGAREETVGFHYTAYGIHLAIEQPQRLAFVTKWLYPDIARRFHTTAYAVERGIRMVAVRAADTPTDLYLQLFPQNSCPVSARFLAAVAAYLSSEGIAA